MHASNIFGEYIFDEYYIKWNTERQEAVDSCSMRSVHISVDFYDQSFFFFSSFNCDGVRAPFRCREIEYIVSVSTSSWHKEIGWHWCAANGAFDDQRCVRLLLLYFRVKCSSNCASNQFLRCLFILLICFVFLVTFFRFDFWVCLQWKCYTFFTLLLTHPK